jgi:DNA-binding NarL/FixJ family response regulator
MWSNGRLVAQHLTRILIVDDHPLVRGALRQAVVGAVAGAEIIESCDLERLNEELAKNPEADLVLLDLAMPGVSGYYGLMKLRAEYPCLPVIVVSGNEDHSVIRRCIDIGASGFIPKTTDFDTMRAAIRIVLEGQIWVPADVDLSSQPDSEHAAGVRRLMSLTSREAQVLKLISDGLLNKQIAYELSISEATVKAHVSAILFKLDVDSRTQAVIAASKLLSRDSPALVVAN